MRDYKIPLVPGPTSVPCSILAAAQVDYGSADLEPEFYELYALTQLKLQQILNTRNDLVIMSGEAMVGLWGALKSCLTPGDKVLSIATGVFGYGIAEMARGITPNVEIAGFEYDEILNPQQVEAVLKKFRPKMVTLVHCETPSGTLNPVEVVGGLIEKYDVPLFYVDAVSSAGGVRLDTDDWNIDLCLAGTQKCLSAPPDLGIVAVSKHAWRIIEAVNYQGYDALLPYKNALARQSFPYTPSWHSIAVLNAACERILNLGLEQVFNSHLTVAEFCRNRILELGLSLFPRLAASCSPTVTAVKVPSGLSWTEFDQKLRKKGVVFGGSIGPLAGKVFQIGHMGTQADQLLIEQGLEVLAQVLKEL